MKLSGKKEKYAAENSLPVLTIQFVGSIFSYSIIKLVFA